MTSSASDVDDLETAVRVTEDIIAGVRPDQRHLPTPCPDYDVGRLVDHLVGFAANFADKVHGIEPPADPAATSAGDDPRRAYHDAVTRMVEGYRAGPAEDATPVSVALLEAVTHGWDLARATGQPTPYPESGVESILEAGRGMLGPQFRGTGMPFGDEVVVPSSAPALHRLVGFMGRDPGWSA